MPSPICLIDKASTTGGFTTSADASLSITLADKTGVDSWKLTIVATDDNHSVATENESLIYNSTTRNYTYTAPSTASTIIFQSIVNGGLKADRTFDASYLTQFTVSVPTSDGYKLIAANQSTEDGENGWAAQINSIISSTSSDVAISNINVVPNGLSDYPEKKHRMLFNGPLTLNTVTVTENVYEVTDSDTVIFLNAGEATEVQLPEATMSRYLYVISMDQRTDHTLTCADANINGSSSPVTIPTYGVTVVGSYGAYVAEPPWSAYTDWFTLIN